MLVDLVRTTTPDGMRLDGALHAASGAPASAFDLAICLHGVQSNFYSSALIEALVPALTALGMAVVRVNTRGHDSVATASSKTGRSWQGAAFEVIDECRLDVLGWLTWAQQHGFARVLLLGHSLGALKCLYVAAHETLASVAAVAAISPPRLSYDRFVEGPANDRFFESLVVAEDMLDQYGPDALFQAKFPFPLFITAGGYLDKYGPGERYNLLRFLEWIDRPTLMVFAGEELESSPAFIDIRKDIAALELPHERFRVVAIDDADHHYSRQHAALGGAIVEWLLAQGSAGADAG